MLCLTTYVHLLHCFFSTPRFTTYPVFWPSRFTCYSVFDHLQCFSARMSCPWQSPGRKAFGIVIEQFSASFCSRWTLVLPVSLLIVISLLSFFVPNESFLPFLYKVTNLFFSFYFCDLSPIRADHPITGTWRHLATDRVNPTEQVLKNNE